MTLAPFVPPSLPSSTAFGHSQVPQALAHTLEQLRDGKGPKAPIKSPLQQAAAVPNPSCISGLLAGPSPQPAQKSELGKDRKAGS